MVKEYTRMAMVCLFMLNPLVVLADADIIGCDVRQDRSQEEKQNEAEGWGAFVWRMVAPIGATAAVAGSYILRAKSSRLVSGACSEKVALCWDNFSFYGLSALYGYSLVCTYRARKKNQASEQENEKLKQQVEELNQLLARSQAALRVAHTRYDQQGLNVRSSLSPA